MPCEVYKKCGVRVRDHCGAEPPRDIKLVGIVTTVGRRDRAPTGYDAAGGIETPASAAGGGFRGIHGGRTAPSVPAETGTTAGTGRLAGSVPAVLVGSRRRPGTPPRSNGAHGPSHA